MKAVASKLIPLFIFLQIAYVCAVFAQKESANNLLEKARNEKNDSARLAQTLHAGKILRFSDVDTALQLMRFVREDAHSKGMINIECSAMDAIAEYYRTEGEYEQCIALADSAIALGKKEKANKEVGTSYQTAGAAYTELGNTKKATEYYHKAIQYHEKAGYAKGVAMTTTNLGSLYYMSGQNRAAINWYKKALVLQQQNSDSNSIAITLTALGQVYYDVKQLDSSEYYTLKAYEIMTTRPLLVNSLYENVLSLYDFAFERNDLALASHWLDIADSLARSQSSEFKVARVLNCRGLIAEKQGNIPLAISLTKQSLKDIEQEGYLLVTSGVYKSLYMMYYNIGDHKNALDAYMKYKELSDSIYNTESTENLNDLNIKYETAKKEKEIAEQRNVIAENQSRLRLLYVLVIGAAIIFLLIVVLYIQNKRTARQKQLALKQEQDIALLKALVTGEEKERSRIARELHDGLGGILAAAQMHLSTLETGQINDLSNLRQSEKLVATAAEETRRIAHNMLPETLLRLGLDEALKEYSRTITDSKLLQVEYESMGMGARVDASAELAIYRVIQELVNNIIKHAKATHAFIQLHRHNNVLSITIEDDGQGFDTKSQQKDGIGLANIKSRINYLNGSVNIKSDKEKGTSVYIEIQLTK